MNSIKRISKTELTIPQKNDIKHRNSRHQNHRNSKQLGREQLINQAYQAFQMNEGLGGNFLIARSFKKLRMLSAHGWFSNLGISDVRSHSTISKQYDIRQQTVTDNTLKTTTYARQDLILGTRQSVSPGLGNKASINIYQTVEN